MKELIKREHMASTPFLRSSLYIAMTYLPFRIISIYTPIRALAALLVLRTQTASYADAHPITTRANSGQTKSRYSALISWKKNEGLFLIPGVTMLTELSKNAF